MIQKRLFIKKIGSLVDKERFNLIFGNRRDKVVSGFGVIDVIGKGTQGHKEETQSNLVKKVHWA